MSHEGGWTEESVDMAALMQSANNDCYICASIWRKYSKFTNEGISLPPTVDRIEYRLHSVSETTFSLDIRVYGAEKSSVGRLCGLPNTRFSFSGVLQSSQYLLLIVIGKFTK